MWHIFNIDQRLQELVNEETGEVSDISEMESLQMERDEKIKGLALMEKEIELRMLNIDQVIEELKEKKEKLSCSAEKIIQFLTIVLDGKNFEAPEVTCKFTSSTRTEIECLDNLPSEYIRFKPEANKTAIREALIKGKMIKGARLVRYINLKIK